MNTYKNNSKSKSSGYCKEGEHRKGSKGKSYSNNYKKNNYRRKTSDKFNTKDDRPNDKAEVYDNNPDWYIVDPTTADQSCNFSFSNYLGNPIDFNSASGTINLVDSGKMSYASIMSIFVNPSPGMIGVGPEARLAAVNQQGFKMYSRLSSINSKNTNYQPNDVTTLILSMGELISFVSWGMRAFGLTWTYNLRNRMMPSKLIEASGFESTTFYNQLAQNRIRFNTLMVNANKIPFPANMNYFLKCNQIFSSVYKDDDTDMSQLYVFRPQSTWFLDETNKEGTSLRTMDLTEQYANGAMPFSEYLDILESKINNMLTSATYNYIYSDILNYAAKNSGKQTLQMLQFGTIPEGYIVMPEYNEQMLSQIHNSTIVGLPRALETQADTYTYTFSDGSTESFTNSNDVYPNVASNSLLYRPAFPNNGISAVLLNIDKILDFNNALVDTKERLEATRLCSMFKSLNFIKDGDLVTKVGYDMVSADHYVTKLKLYSTLTAAGVDINSNIYMNNGYMDLIFNFRLIPILYSISVGTMADNKIPVTMNSVMNNLNFFTTIDANTLGRIDDLSLYGLFEPYDFEYGGVSSVITDK